MSSRWPNGKGKMEKLNFALIGAGKFGKNYLRLLQETKGISLKTVVTRSPIPTDNTSVFYTADLEKVLSDPSIDCAVIATPPATHLAIAKAALTHKKHVLLEKPMALNLKEAEDLKKTVRDSGQIFMVGFQYLFNSYIQYLKKEIESGAFGEIKNIASEHFQSPPREDVNAFWDAAPHPLAIFQFLFNPEKILKAKGELRRDFAEAAAEFDRGPKLNITVSWPGKKKVRKLTIQGEKITAILDETKPDGKLSLVSNKDGEIIVPVINAEEPLKNEVAHFIDCIHGQKIPLTNITFGYFNTQWLEEISNKLQ